jgi:hypothetical protein
MNELNKKEKILAMIQRFQEYAEQAPSELMSELESIRAKLESLSNEEIEMLDGPSTTPAGEKEYNPANPVMRLAAAYSDMEKFAYTGDENEELYHVIQQMRGFYDIPDRYYP